MMSSRRVPFFVVLCVLSMPAVRAQNAGISGHWEGKIELPNQEVGVTVDLSRSEAGTWIGSMSVTGSSAIDVPLHDLTVDRAHARFSARLPEQASFDLSVSADANTLSGVASNAKGSVPLQLTRGGEAKVSVPPPSTSLSKNFEGTWAGTIEAGATVRHVSLRLLPASDGTAVGTLIAVDQANLEIPATTVTVDDTHLQIEARAVSGRYRGTLIDGAIVGDWVQGETRLPLTFKRAPADGK